MKLANEHPEAARLFLKASGLETGAPDLSFLKAIMRAYAAIPYENITKILRFHEHASWESRLRMPLDVIQEHLEFKAGGTCFSLAFSLDSILRYAGFTTSIAMAHMPSGRNRHCAVIVTTEAGRFLADPGFLIPVPVPLPVGPVPSVTPGGGPGLVRLRREGTEVSLSSVGTRGEKLRYRLADVPVAEDVFLRHWMDSFDLPMLNGICVTALREAAHIYLHNNHFRATRGDDVIKENVREEYGERIERLFGIHGKLVERARDILHATGTSRIKMDRRRAHGHGGRDRAGGGGRDVGIGMAVSIARSAARDRP